MMRKTVAAIAAAGALLAGLAAASRRWLSPGPVGCQN